MVCTTCNTTVNDFFNSATDLFKVFTLIDLLGKAKEYFLNCSKSVSSEYLSTNFSLKITYPKKCILGSD